MKKYILFISALLSFGILNAQEFQMSNGSQTTCSGVFTDSQGTTGNYAAGENFNFTICPTISTNSSQVSFTEFILAPGDVLIAYDGDSANAPFIGAFGSFLAPTVIEASSSNTSGCVTFVFNSNPSSPGALGWSANINCANGGTTITNVSSTSANGAYGIGATIPISIQFNEIVTVTGTPRLNLETGTIDAIATYSSGSGSDILIFNYIVQAGDLSQDLNYPSSSSLILNGGSIKNNANDDATLTLPNRASPSSLGGNKNIRIDGVAPQGYNIALDLSGESAINLNNATNIKFDITGAEVGTRLDFTFSSSGGTAVITRSVTITSSNQLVDNNGSGYNLSSLADGTVTLTAALIDNTNNSGVVVSDNVIKFTGTNDDLVNATELLYNNTSTARPYNFTNATVEADEVFTTFNGNAISSNTTGSLWFKFVATTTEVLIRTDSDDVMNLAIQLIDAANDTPVFTDLSNYRGRYGNDLNGTAYEPWISEESLTIGETYFIQVHNIDGTDTNFNLLIEEARSYIYAGGAWVTALGNPDGINDPYASVAITSGNVAFTAASTLVGDLGTATNATLTIPDNSTLTVNGRLFTGSIATSIEAGTGSTLTFIDHGNDFLFGSGVTTGLSNLHDVAIVNRLGNSIGSSMNVYGSFKSKNDVMITAATTTFKHTSDGLGVLANDPQFTGELSGNVTVENFIPERNGTEKRAFIFLGSPVTSTSTIFNQWQEGGNSPTGFGTHITGSGGTVGTIDPATGLDQTISGNNSLFGYNATATAWEAVNSTNQAGDSFTTGNGYRLFVRGDRNVDLSSNASSNNTTLRSSGTLSMADKSMNYDVESGQFVLIANPYQNAVSIEELIDDSMNITDDIVYYWDPNIGGAAGLGAYVTYTGFDNGGSGSGLPAATSNNGFIQPGQAVFIVADAGANGPTNDMIVNYSKTQLSETGVLRGAANRVNSIDNANGDRITMNMYDTFSYENGYSVTDAISLRFSSQFSNTIGTGDFTKIYNAHESIAISQENSDFAIASREIPLNDEIIQLKHYNYGDVDYTYVIELEGLLESNVFLYDNYLSTSTPLVSGSNVFAFNVEAAISGSMDTDRFQLRFEDVTLGIGEVNAGADFVMYPNPAESDELATLQSSQFSDQEMTLTITDLSGKLIHSKMIQFDNQGNFELKTTGLGIGIYLIELTDNKEIKITKKLVIK